MRKLLSALIILSLMLTVQASLAEDIIVLSSPDTQESKAVGSLDDMTLNAEVDLGDRIYTLYKANVTKNIAYSNDYPIEGSDVSSVAAVWVRVFNFANKDQSFFKDANVIVTYESERGPYQFGGAVIQNTSSDDVSWREIGDADSVSPLYNGYYVFYCKIPDYAAENPGELKIDIIDGQTTMTYYFRR